MKLDPNTGKPDWSPRVRMDELRRLYLNDAAGILDESLLDDVGITLYCRCESILEASDALLGKIHCPSCANIIARSRNSRDDAKIVCPKCGWTLAWLDYLKTFQHKDLWGGGFSDAMREFIARWNSRPSPREKMLLIDRLIHLWHWQSSPERAATRPAAPTFIEGSRKQVIKFLDDLTKS